jgi:hypothetical protein
MGHLDVILIVALLVKEALEEKEEFDRVKDKYPPINPPRPSSRQFSVLVVAIVADA